MLAPAAILAFGLSALARAVEPRLSAEGAVCVFPDFCDADIFLKSVHGLRTRPNQRRCSGGALPEGPHNTVAQMQFGFGWHFDLAMTLDSGRCFIGRRPQRQL